VQVQYKNGRTMLDFQSQGVNHTFILGELQGEEASGMPSPTTPCLAEETLRQLNEATSTLSGVRDKVTSLKTVTGFAGSRKHAMDTGTLKIGDDLQSLLEGLSAFQKSFEKPGLAPVDMKWGTEGKLKRLLAAHHPPCKGQDRRNWTIARCSGKCTNERLANTKSTVAAPKTVPLISQLKLPEVIEECSGSGTLLVVVCLATYALEQSTYARTLAEKVYAQVQQRFAQGADGAGGPAPAKFVSVELSEIGGFAKDYGIKEVPHCLMFSGRNVVYSQHMGRKRLMTKEAGQSKPCVLLVEPDPANQLKLEQRLRRAGATSDLAMTGTEATRLLTTRSVVYDALLISGRIRVDQQRTVASAMRRQEPGAKIMLFDASVEAQQDEDPEARKRFHQECSQIWAYAPGCTALAAVLSRSDVDDKRRLAGAGVDKRDFLSEVLGVLQRGGVRAPASAVAAGGPALGGGPDAVAAGGDS